jgi:Fe2+ transport system protein B
MKPMYKIWAIYILLILFMMITSVSYSQISNKGIESVQFNASWNKDNNVEFFNKLKNCKKTDLSIDDSEIQKKYGIVVVPTIIIFNNGEEIKRFQADLSFKITATRKEIQYEIDKLIMNKF